MDLLCWDDVDEFGEEIDDPLQELDQDVFHMLLETFGSNPDAPSRGVGLRAKLSGTITIDTAREVESRVAEDERISAARCTFTPLPDPGEYRMDLRLQVGDLEILLAYDVDGAGGLRRKT